MLTKYKLQNMFAHLCAALTHVTLQTGGENAR